jgi:hypothetical protein
MICICYPAIYNYAPAYWGTPDIQYVKAKMLRVMEGDLFADPVTSITNFHPPYYHLFLSVFSRLGANIDSLLLWVSVVNMLLLFLLVYLITRVKFGDDIALWVTLLVPYMLEYMGPSYAFLATAFYFSMNFYLLGLWLYLQNSQSKKFVIVISLCWGLAFILSPVYIFLISIIFAYKIIVEKEYRRTALMIGIFSASCIPFIIQGYIIYQSGLAGTAAFSLWRGIPEVAWFKNLIIGFISPKYVHGFDWFAGFSPIIMLLGFFGIFRSVKRPYFVMAAIIAYILTAYHFNLAYASRIQFFISIFLAGYAILYLWNISLSKAVCIILIFIIASTGFYSTLEQSSYAYARYNKMIDAHEDQRYMFRQNFPRHVEPGTFVLAYHDTYRYLIMPYYPVHALVAYRSGEYFQLNSEIAQTMLSDYNTIMASASIDTINHYCDKYGINEAVAYVPRDMQMPAFQTISRHWQTVYSDRFFRIYKRNSRI